MPTYGTRCGNYPANETAGMEVSSTYEGRHLTFLESELAHPTHTPELVVKGDPVVIGREIVGIAFKSAVAATDLIAIDTEGIWNLSIVATDDLGSVVVAPGDVLFINRSTCIISKIADPAVNTPFGYALGTITSGNTAVIAVKVHFDPSGIETDDSIIVISTSGNDTYGKGSWSSPVASITKALTLVTATRLTIYVMPGDYVEAATLTWPSINGVRLIGMDGNGNVVISNVHPHAAVAVITINPTFTSASFEAFLENVCIEHEAQVGIQIDNAGMGTRKLLIHLKGVSTNQVNTGNSIDVNHSIVGQAIRLYMEDCREIEGLIDFLPGSGTADDRLRLRNCDLIGGVTIQNVAVAMELSIAGCVVLTDGLDTGNVATVVSVWASAYRTDAGVYSTLAESLNG